MADGEVVIDTSLDSSGVENGLGKLGQIAGRGLKATTGAIAAVSTALAGMAAYAIKAGSDFESGMGNVEAISGASSQKVTTATGDIVDGLTALTEKAKEMGATTKFSAKESSDALGYMAMAGWDAQEMYDGLAGVMSLAAASGEDLATTSDIVTDALTAFGMGAEDSGHFADILAKASASANTNVGLMGETFKYVAPLCGTMGYSAEDAAVAIGLMANSGIKGGQAGTALKTALANMAAPTKAMATQMKALGIEITNSDGSSKSLMEVIQNLRTSFDGLSESEQTAAASTIFGKEAMSGMLAIINSSDEDFNKLTDAIYNCDGAAEEMAAIMQNNLQGQVTILKSNIEGLGIAVYEKLQEPLKELAVKGQEYITQLTTAFNEGGFSGLVGEIGAVLADVVTEMVAQAPRMVEASVGVIDAFVSGLRGAIPILAPAMVDIGSAIIDGILEIAPELAMAGLEMLDSLGSEITAAAPSFLDKGAGLVSSLLSGIIESAPNVMQAGVELLQSLAEGITQSLPNLIPLAIQAIVTLAQGFVSNIGSIVDIGISIINALVDGLINALPTLIEQVPKLINDFWSAFDQNLGKILQAGIQLVIKLCTGIIQSIPLIIQNAGEIVKAIGNTIMHLDLLSAGKTLITNLASGIKSMLGSAGSASKAIAEKILTVIKTTDWKQLGATIMDFFKSGIHGMVSAVGSAAKAVATTALNIIQNTNWLELGGKIVTFIANGLKGMASSLWNAAVDLAKQCGQMFLNCDWLSIGSNIISGIAGGIASAAGSLVNAAVSAARNAINAVKGWLGIRSPSRRARDEIGKHILPGIGKGIEESEPELDETMENAAEKMLKSFDNHSQNVDVSGLVRRMQAGVEQEVGHVVTTATVKVNSGSGQVPVTAAESIDYDRMGDSVADAIGRSDIRVECDDREFGRLVSDHTPE